jgi:dihydrofolate reductase
MRNVVYSMNVSLDGYIVGPDGSFNWSAPEEEVFRWHTEQTRGLAAYLIGRKLYEAMLYWETVEQSPDLDFDTVEWSAIWRSLPKVVFSKTLSEVEGNARLATGGLAEEVERLRAEPGDGEVSIGGAMLAGEALELGLVDEIRTIVYPVFVGGGIPFYPQRERRVDLERVEARPIGSQMVCVRYRVVR